MQAVHAWFGTHARLSRCVAELSSASCIPEHWHSSPRCRATSCRAAEPGQITQVSSPVPHDVLAAQYKCTPSASPSRVQRDTGPASTKLSGIGARAGRSRGSKSSSQLLISHSTRLYHLVRPQLLTPCCRVSSTAPAPAAEPASCWPCCRAGPRLACDSSQAIVDCRQNGVDLLKARGRILTACACLLQARLSSSRLAAGHGSR